jgi:hypothetical protein
MKTTLNRPYGTYTSIAIYPGLASWAKVNRAYGAASQSDDPFRIQECHLRITGATRRSLARDDRWEWRALPGGKALPRHPERVAGWACEGAGGLRTP